MWYVVAGAGVLTTLLLVAYDRLVLRGAGMHPEQAA
jgi:hypothetical protein